jgi:hypothetical protein
VQKEKEMAKKIKEGGGVWCTGKGVEKKGTRKTNSSYSVNWTTNRVTGVQNTSGELVPTNIRSARCQMYKTEARSSNATWVSYNGEEVSGAGVAQSVEWLGLDDRRIGVRFPAGDRDCSLRHGVQTSSGANPSSYPKCAGAQWPLTYIWCRRLRNNGAIPPLSHASLWHGA